MDTQTDGHIDKWTHTQTQQAEGKQICRRSKMQMQTQTQTQTQMQRLTQTNADSEIDTSARVQRETACA